jgi:hypothetical protein
MEIAMLIYKREISGELDSGVRTLEEVGRVRSY